MRTRMVRIRRKTKPVWKVVLLFILTLAAYLYVTYRQGDPVAAVIGEKDADRVKTAVVFEALELHAVRTAACSSEESARIEAARYVSRGAAGYIYKDETWHVLCSGYERESDALAVRQQLKEGERMECDTLSMVCDPVTLNVTATREQAKALVECEGTLRTTVSLIGALSYAIDGGKTSVSQAISVLKEQNEALIAARKAFDAATGGVSDSVVCAPLLGLVDNATKGISYLLGDCGDLPSMLFSGKMKYFFLQLRIGQIQYIGALGG